MKEQELIQWKKQHHFQPHTKITPEKIDKLIEAVSEGLTEKQACAYAGVQFKTFRDWMQHYLDHGEDSPYKIIGQPIQHARSKLALRLLNSIEEAGKNPKNWTANAWMLERIFADEYARPEVLLKQPDNVPKVIVQIGNVENLNLKDVLDKGVEKSIIDAQILEPAALPAASAQRGPDTTGSF